MNLHDGILQTIFVNLDWSDETSSNFLLVCKRWYMMLSYIVPWIINITNKRLLVLLGLQPITSIRILLPSIFKSVWKSVRFHESNRRVALILKNELRVLKTSYDKISQCDKLSIYGQLRNIKNWIKRLNEIDTYYSLALWHYIHYLFFDGYPTFDIQGIQSLFENNIYKNDVFFSDTYELLESIKHDNSKQDLTLYLLETNLVRFRNRFKILRGMIIAFISTPNIELVLQLIDDEVDNDIKMDTLIYSESFKIFVEFMSTLPSKLKRKFIKLKGTSKIEHITPEVIKIVDVWLHKFKINLLLYQQHREGFDSEVYGNINKIHQCDECEQFNF